ncbi:hypothetical protein GCM10007425_30570 [Lysinibacillus alkalisoli]|uniref:Uncharacterized protein n=1 Tax=Lysinibacillus alkalisoli TaxID=1911548 RepID=A0A917GB24_9BACI|nr:MULTISPECIES: hypothetical protein [Bacillales]GGG33765.1 hypothetical protein GCM10007425_30570 [Lysinibacillus alkalisoli]
MNDIKKKLARMEQLKQQIRDSQEALDHYFGKQLISKLNLKYEDLNKEALDQIVLTLTTLYEDYHDH